MVFRIGESGDPMRLVDFMLKKDLAGILSDVPGDLGRTKVQISTA
jgi:hypothetical protein